MSKHQIAWLSFVILFIGPVVVFFVGNFYGWLWDGVLLDTDKMGASICWLMITSISAVVWADIGNVWKRK